jgi:hypothetical protein
MATPSSTVPGYGLAPPTQGDALASLARAVGPDRAADLWLRACAEAGVPRSNLDVDDMMRVAERLAEQEGVVGVIGTSLAVRARTYRLLASTQARAEGK